MKKILTLSFGLITLLTAGAQNVGIGTTAPGAPLHVKSVTSPNPVIIDGSSPMYIALYEAGVYKGYLGSYSGNADDIDFGTGSGSTAALHLTTGATPRLTIVANGNVGIGTFSGAGVPLARLEVKGVGNNSATNTFALRSLAGDTLLRMRDDGRIGIGYNGASYGRTLNLGGTGQNFYTTGEAAFGGAIFPTDTSLVIWSNSGVNNYLVFQPSWGNTGIGTYTPNAKLHINGGVLIGNNSARLPSGYSFAIDGKAICEELKVQLSTAWPDYVFENSYPMPNLDDLEKQVMAQKHLPNIPAASEVETAKGFEVGDMQNKLLEKVEELYRYVFQLNNENKAMKAEIKTLKGKR